MSNRYGGARIRRGLSHFIIGKGVSAVAGLLCMLLVIRGLSIESFAAYSVLTALVELFTALTGLGLVHALLRYVPELYAKQYQVSLRKFTYGAFGIRTAVLLLAALLAFMFADKLAPEIGLSHAIDAYEVFLLIVVLRSSTHFLSQVLESTLHQSIVQIGFTAATLIRLAGMLYLVQQGAVQLVDVIWVEAISDLVSMLIMLGGIVWLVTRQGLAHQNSADDGTWLSNNMRQIKHLAITGYAQHIIGLPFGSNTNRLVGGSLFSLHTMASFGFAQSIYEYVKRYLPAQLLVGLIRPVVVARFSEKRDFSAAAAICDRVGFINITIISAILSVLLVGGLPILKWISADKYGTEALWVLITLMLVLALETHRLTLEMLVQTVERYAILIPSNFFLALSVLPGILFFKVLGAVSFPLMNALALLLCNAWVKHKLATEGYAFANNTLTIAQLLGVAGLSALIGLCLNTFHIHWVASTFIAQIVFALGAWHFFGATFKALFSDVVGRKAKLL